MSTFYRANSLVGRMAVILGLAIVKPGFAVADAPPIAGETDATGHSGRVLSAFFGLDNGLPFRANLLCLGASGQDGMPVVLSHTIDPETLRPEYFQVVTRSGAKRTPQCVTLRPAQDAGELRTVLLIGEFGDAHEDPPVAVHVVGDLRSDGAGSKEDVAISFRGSHTTVIPLDAGPSLVLAESVPTSDLATRDQRHCLPGGHPTGGPCDLGRWGTAAEP